MSKLTKIATIKENVKEKHNANVTVRIVPTRQDAFVD